MMLYRKEKIINSCIECEQCGKICKSAEKFIWNVRSLNNDSRVYSISDLMMELIQKIGQDKCCLQSLRNLIKKEKVVIMKISNQKRIFFICIRTVIWFKNQIYFPYRSKEWPKSSILLS